MDDKQFDTLLEKVHAEIQGVEQMDEKGRELLEDLEKDIHDLLMREKGVQASSPFLQLLQEAIEHFEVSHPTLTTMLSELSNILNNAGI